MYNNQRFRITKIILHRSYPVYNRIMAKTTTTLKNAAHKAWETRKKRALIRKNAAIKAWETRRLNELAVKRSNAAKKAWATRIARAA